MDEDKIINLKTRTLGGFSSQIRLSPSYRQHFNEDEVKSQNPRLAVVNILLYLKNGRIYFPLIQRSEYGNNVHSGQISLPGGKSEPFDPSEWHTARRETMEEIGVDEVKQIPIRELTHIYIPPSNFWVGVWLSYMKEPADFSKDTREVENIWEIAVEDLLKALKNPSTMIPQFGDSSVPCLDFGEIKVWGATAMILSEFGDLW